MKHRNSRIGALVIPLALALIWPTTFVSHGVGGAAGRPGALSQSVAATALAPRFVQTAAVQAPTARTRALTDPASSSPASEIGASYDQIARQISAVINRPRYRGADWGLDVRLVDDDTPVFTHDPDKFFPPASNAKLFTTATALGRLGSNFRFRTSVAYEGAVTPDQRLVGDLVLIGRGDPDLSGTIRVIPEQLANIDALALKVREFGISEVEGDVVGDDSYFEWLPYGDGWMASDLTRDYGAPVSALSFNDNLITLSVRPGSKSGQPGSVSVYPAESLLKVVNKTRTVINARRNSLQWYHKPGADVVSVSGAVSRRTAGASQSFLVRDPALYTATLFKERLIRAGIKVKGVARARHSGQIPPTTTRGLICSHESPPLMEVLAFTNKKSQNLYAEILLRTLGAEIKGKGSDQAGLEVIYEFLKDAGVPPSSARLYDGSGLSRYSMITPRAETMLLNHMAAQPYFSEFVGTLAIAGLDGTLHGRMVNGPAFQRVFGKTGSLQGVTTLGGYVRTESGKTLSFSILINNHRYSSASARRAIDQICDILATM